MTADLPPRWLVRRTSTGKWLVRRRVTFAGAYLYERSGVWDTWDDALAYVARVQINNYGAAA